MTLVKTKLWNASDHINAPEEHFKNTLLTV